MIDSLAFIIVCLVGLHFVALGIAALVAPGFTKTFLLGFATTPAKHYTELVTRLIVGGAFLVHSSNMLFPSGFNFFGWLLVGTTTALFIVPWQWHHRFAQHTVPQALRHIALIGFCSLVLGGFVLFAVVRGAAA